MRLTVHGPNGMPDGITFHVHVAGCADLARRPHYRRSRGEAWTADFDSVQDVVVTTYSDIMSENDETDDDYERYLGEFHFFPCTEALPQESEAPMTV